jgi:hypothetical protein
MNLISFDVGIKNLAYCIFQFKDNELTVQDWNIINLLEPNKPLKTCTFEIKSKKQTKICGKKAKYTKADDCFCETHAKMAIKQNGWFFPNDQLKQSILAKKSKDDLFVLGQEYQLFITIPKTKKECIETILQHCGDKCLEKIKKVKTKTANDTDLITVGKKMRIELDKVECINSITHVAIENQISKIASRMKTVQGMLSQYFIMQDICPIIEYISSLNKLKDLTSNKEINSYKQHKSDSVEFCKLILGQNPSLGNFDDLFNVAKKDDLADAFLQGIWYLKKNKLISYADNLKINSITLT